MNIFEGLNSYEIVLLVLGVLFFVVLLFVLFYFVRNNRSIGVVVPLFLIAIVMIGFPSVKKIQIYNFIIEFERLTKRVEQNPSDTIAREALASNLSKIERLPNLRQSTLKKIDKAKVYLRTGNKGTK